MLRVNISQNHIWKILGYHDVLFTCAIYDQFSEWFVAVNMLWCFFPAPWLRKRNFTLGLELIKTKHCLPTKAQSLEIHLIFVLRKATRTIEFSPDLFSWFCRFYRIARKQKKSSRKILPQVGFDPRHLWLSSHACYPRASSPYAVSRRHLNDHIIMLYWFLD